MEILTTVNDHLEAELLQGILANQGIPSYSQDEELSLIHISIT